MSSDESSNFNEKEDKEELDTIRCDNCRQDIERKKMFLHEGFCHRNNVFCEHCEQVFLKEDYEQHIIDLPKNLTSKKDDISKNSNKSTSNEEDATIPVISQQITTINPNTSLEFVHLPLVEEYTINTPIVISESGEIVSNKNKNEFLLPFLGINPIHSYNYANQYIMNTNSNIQNSYQNYSTYTFGGQSQSYQKNLRNTFNYYESNLQTNYQNYDNIFSKNFIEPNYNNVYKENYQVNNNIVINNNNNVIEFENNNNFNEINSYLPSEISKGEIINPNNNYPKGENKPIHKLKVEVLRTPLKKEPTDNIAKSTALKNALNKSQKKLYNYKTYKESDKKCFTEKKKIIVKKRKTSKTLVENKSFQLKINRAKPLKYRSSKMANPKLFTESFVLEKEVEPQPNEFDYENENKSSVYTETKSSSKIFRLSKKYITPIVTKIKKKTNDNESVKYGSDMNVTKNLFPREFPIENYRNKLIYTQERNYPGRNIKVNRNRNVYAQSAERNRVRTIYNNLNFTPQEKYRTGLSEAIYYSAYKSDKESLYNGMDNNYDFNKMY